MTGDSYITAHKAFLTREIEARAFVFARDVKILLADHDRLERRVAELEAALAHPSPRTGKTDAQI